MLAVGYRGKTVLDALTLEFKEGQFIALLGPNGAGKTTLLRTLARLLPPREGAVYLDGKALQSIPQQELARALSVVLTGHVSPGLMSGFEFVSLGRYPHTGLLGKLKEKDVKAVEEALAMVHAEALAHRRMQTLSDGERQKILIARALAQSPRIILLDEPTMHLDLKHRMEVMTILQRLCREKGITVIASMHDVDIASKVADRVALIKDGGVQAWGPPEEVLREEAVADLYGFEGAAFNQCLGSIEIKGDGCRGTVFVAAGIGSGAILYRMLAKRGFTIATGVLHGNDLDAYVAGSLGARCVLEAPMEAISKAALEGALDLLKSADCIVDSGFPVGAMNQKNVELIREGLAMGKPAFTIRETPAEGLPPSGNHGPLPCRDASELLERLEAHFELRGNGKGSE
jgi:iron complex transport system ATP-binding protein